MKSFPLLSIFFAQLITTLECSHMVSAFTVLQKDFCYEFEAKY